MARDYAKRRPARRVLTAGVSSSRSSKSGGKRSRSKGMFKHLPYLLVGVMVGLLIAGFFHLKMQPLTMAHEKVSNEDTPAKITTVKKPKLAHHKKAAVAHNSAQPHYDFYTMLTKEKGSENSAAEDTLADEEDDEDEDATVKTQVAELKAQKDEEEPAEHIVPKKEAAAAGKYMLQIASLKKQQDADRLKARLTLEGYNVFISKQKIKNTLYYRVNIGPYQTAATAKCHQKRLQRSHIKSLLITA